MRTGEKQDFAEYLTMLLKNVVDKMLISLNLIVTITPLLGRI